MRNIDTFKLRVTVRNILAAEDSGQVLRLVQRVCSSIKGARKGVFHTYLPHTYMETQGKSTKVSLASCLFPVDMGNGN